MRRGAVLSAHIFGPVAWLISFQFLVRAFTGGKMVIDKERQRARWKRNKEASRDRARAKAASQKRSLDPEFLQRVDEERNKRATAAYSSAYWWLDTTYLYGERLGRAIELAADVWWATIVYEAAWGDGTATTARIVDSLKDSGRTHGYTDGSLRKMVLKARERIRILETHEDPRREGHVIWPPFDAFEA